MCAAHVASMTGFAAYSTLLPRLQDEWGLNNSQAGFISGAFFPGYMAAVPLPVSLPDPVDARPVYFASTVVPAAALPGMALCRPVLRTREVRPYVSGYAVHCWELFGSRSWLVAFIVFSQQLQSAGGTAPAAWSAVTIAAVANLLGPAASIGGNELAMRHGRERPDRRAMLASGLPP